MSRDIVAVPETPVRLRVNGLDAVSWSCSPRALEALGAGRLLSLGFVARREELIALEVEPGEPGEPGEAGASPPDGSADPSSADPSSADPSSPDPSSPDPSSADPSSPDPSSPRVIRAEVDAARAAAAIEERDHRAEHGCGVRFFLDCRPQLLRGPGSDTDRGGAAYADPPRAPLPDLDAFPELFRQLYAGSERYKATGGVHTSCLSDGATVSRLHEEVARHNGVDKAIGDAFLEGAELDELGLVTTARISAEMALKAARSGLAWIASRSVPTTLAVEIAAAAGIPIVARAAKPEPRVFGAGAA